MDRVLLLFDDLGYASHVEKTLRKIGFDTETLANDYNLNEKLLSFNPEYILVKGGQSSKVSSLQIGKKLKENNKFSGKVILLFPENEKPVPEELIKLRMDLLVIEPISALRLTAYLLNLSGSKSDALMDKLIRIAHTDAQFRQNEMQILKSKGESVETEIQLISDKMKQVDEPSISVIDENSIESFVNPNAKPVLAKSNIPSTSAQPPQEDLKEAAKKSPVKKQLEDVNHVTGKSDKDEVVSVQGKVPKSNQSTSVSGSQPPVAVEPPNEPELLENEEVDPGYFAQLKNELMEAELELPLRIESYNQAISTIDQDLKKGLSKRQTKKRALELLDLTSKEEKNDRDLQKRKFANALSKKNK